MPPTTIRVVAVHCAQCGAVLGTAPDARYIVAISRVPAPFVPPNVYTELDTLVAFHFLTCLECAPAQPFNPGEN